MNEPSAAAATDPAPASPFELRDQRLVAAPLVRRMVAFMYEGVLLFGVLFTLNLVYYGFTKQTNATQTHTPLLVLTFFVLGTYFIYFWIRGGQTLAQKTWHLRVLTAQGHPMSPRRALARYMASWLWFLPPLMLISALGLAKSPWTVFGLLGAWVALYALSALLHPRRQFWHDALCDTAVVHVRPAPLPVL